MAFRWSKQQKKVFDRENRGQNLLVRASAGSGKTAVLVERILSLIDDEKQPADIDRFLVVTFTNAAASELREKIRRRLAQAAAERPDNAHLARQLVLIHNAPITTIDGFCTQLLRDYGHLSELPADFRIAEAGENKLLAKDVLSSVLMQLYAGETEIPLEDFHLLVESFATGKSDAALGEAILQLAAATESQPYPAAFLGACREKTAVSREMLADAGWLSYLPEEARDAAAGKLPLEEKSGAVLSVLISVTQLYLEALGAAKMRRKIADFADIEHFALALLRDAEGRRTALAKDLARRFVTVMVDEYQDSNYLQEAILTAVARTEDGEDNYFSVGDIKQSIYAFRNADPTLFLEKGVLYAQGGGRCIDLQENFRSRPEVTDAVNAIFAQIMRAEVGGVDYDDTATLVAGAAYPAGDEGQYQAEMLLVESGDGSSAKSGDGSSDFLLNNGSFRRKSEEPSPGLLELEARAVAERIAEMLAHETIYDEDLQAERPVRGGDIAILLRTMKGRAQAFEEALVARGIEVFSTVRGMYFDAQEVLLVLDLLEILVDPLLDIPMAAVLVSPMAGLTPEELGILRAAPGAPYAKKRAELPKLYELARGYAAGPLPESAAADAAAIVLPYDAKLALKLSRFLSFYDSLRERIPYTPLHELLTQILEESGYLHYVRALPGGVQRMANLQMLIDKALAYEAGSYVGLFNFIRYIRNLEAVKEDFGEAPLTAENGNAVRICSIHKSKGLQYPIVFVADLAKKINDGDATRALLIDRTYGLAADYVDVASRVKLPTPKHTALSKKKRTEVLGEELRVYYVACTRAQQKLVLSCVLPAAEKLEEMQHPEYSAREIQMPAEKILAATNVSEWFLPAVFRLEKRCAAEKTACPVAVKTVSPAELVVAEVHKETDRAKNLATLRNLSTDAVYDAAMQKVLRERFDFVYPYADHAALPVKLTVTALKEGEARDEDAAELYPAEEIIPTVPAFVREKDGADGALADAESAASGAFRGTAQHEFMRFVNLQAFGDLGAAVSVAVVAAEVARLAAAGKLSKEQAALVDVRAMAAFLGSPLGVRLRAADARGELFREQPFVLRVPASRIDASYPDDETVLVQGIMDAFFAEAGKLVLVDYKSDRVKDVEDLREKYHLQLRFYREALVALRGMDVAETVIWSFHQNEGVVV